MTDSNTHWDGSSKMFHEAPTQQWEPAQAQMRAAEQAAQAAQAQAAQAAQAVPTATAGAYAAQGAPTPVQPANQAGQQWQAAQAQQAQAWQAAPQQPAAMPAAGFAQPKKNRMWIVALVVAVCLFAFCAFAVKSCTDAVSAATGGVQADAAPNSVAVIDIDGAIQYDGTACSPEGFKALLDEASDDDNIKAVVLRVNSGGGTATAGEEMAEYLAAFDKPVVVSSASINASAAYEISSQADYIYVAKSTEIGAIGTAMQVMDVSGLMDMLGIDVDVIVSADSKDSSYGYRPLTEEEREYYQHMVEQINETFVQTVADGRGMSVEGVRLLANGLPYTGLDAVNNGLADEVGTLEDAADKAADLAGIGDYELYSLSFSDYDLAGLYDLLGKQNSSTEELLKVLSQKQGANTAE